MFHQTKIFMFDSGNHSHSHSDVNHQLMDSPRQAYVPSSRTTFSLASSSHLHLPLFNNSYTLNQFSPPYAQRSSNPTFGRGPTHSLLPSQRNSQTSQRHRPTSIPQMAKNANTIGTNATKSSAEDTKMPDAKSAPLAAQTNTVLAPVNKTTSAVAKKEPIKYPLLNAVAKPGSLSLVGEIPVPTTPAQVDVTKVDFKDMTSEQKGGLLKQKPYNPTVEIRFCVKDANGRETTASMPGRVSKKLLLTFSTVARKELKEQQHQVLLLNNATQKPMEILLAYMEDCCGSQKIPHFDVESLTGFQWIRLWNAAKALGFDVAVEQLQKQLWHDAHSLDFTNSVDTWVEARKLKLESPEKVLRSHLHDYAWHVHGQIWPCDLEYLQEMAPDADFTHAAMRKTAQFLFNHVPRLNPYKAAEQRLSEPTQKALKVEFDYLEAKIENKIAKELRLKGNAERAAKREARAKALANRPPRPFRAAEPRITLPPASQYVLVVASGASQKERQRQRQAEIESAKVEATKPKPEPVTPKPVITASAATRTGSTTLSSHKASGSDTTSVNVTPNRDWTDMQADKDFKAGLKTLKTAAK